MTDHAQERVFYHPPTTSRQLRSSSESSRMKHAEKGFVPSLRDVQLQVSAIVKLPWLARDNGYYGVNQRQSHRNGWAGVAHLILPAEDARGAEEVLSRGLDAIEKAIRLVG